MIIKVKKRGNFLEDFQPEKLNKWAEYGCDGDSSLWSSLSTAAFKKLHDGVSTRDIQRALISAAAEMIPTNLKADKAAAKLELANLRKEVFNKFTPPQFISYYKELVAVGIWDDMSYSDEELLEIGKALDHDRDDLFTYAGLKQVRDKYLYKNIKGDYFETPQFMYMGMAMAAMEQEPEAIRIRDVIGLYDALSQHKGNVPTPLLIGLRTPDKGFASCCVISGGDTLDSINAATNVAYTMTAKRAGIGLELDTRSINDPVRDGKFPHMGKLPYYKFIDRAVKANTQQSRGGSATVQFPIFDPEIETLLALKSQRVSEEMRIDKMDYSVSMNDFFIRKFVKNEKIALFSKSIAPEVHEAFYSSDLDNFEDVYNRNLHKASKTMNARDVFTALFRERLDTGRIYIHRVDVSNKYTPFDDPIRLSNLCQEILLPTKPFDSVEDLYKEESSGEIALCNLAGIVAGRVSEDEYERIAYLMLKMVDNVIEMQEYPYASMKYTALRRRSAGIGLINLHGYIASHFTEYNSRKGRSLAHEEAERYCYWLHKASVQLAKEKGKCGFFDKTKYSRGWMPLDDYSKEVDKHHDAKLALDWEGLRKEIAQYGMRNSVLTACMPSESSSVAISATNGIEPIRQVITYKASRQGVVPFVAPGGYDVYYDLAFDISYEGIAQMVGIVQKFVQQSISYNEYYDYGKFPDGMIPMGLMLNNFLTSAKLGIRTFYYLNSKVNTGGAAHNQVEASCTSCTL